MKGKKREIQKNELWLVFIYEENINYPAIKLRKPFVEICRNIY